MKALLSVLSLLLFPIFYPVDNEIKIIQLKDYDDNLVEFFLVSKDGDIVLKSNDGALHKSQLVNYKEKTFTLHFDNHLAYLLYHNDIYFENGMKLKDKHIKYDKVKYDKLNGDKDGFFFVRRREIRLDRGGDEDGGK